jgi:nitrogen fixation protein
MGERRKKQPTRWREASDVAAEGEDRLGGGILSPDGWRSFLRERRLDEDDDGGRIFEQSDWRIAPRRFFLIKTHRYF